MDAVIKFVNSYKVAMFLNSAVKKAIVHVYLPFAEYIAFCDPLPCQESFTFFISNLTTYCKRAEDEQAGDVTGELQVHLFFPCEIMFTIRARESSWLCAGKVQSSALFL